MWLHGQNLWCINEIQGTYESAGTLQEFREILRQLSFASRLWVYYYMQIIVPHICQTSNTYQVDKLWRDDILNLMYQAQLNLAKVITRTGCVWRSPVRPQNSVWLEAKQKNATTEDTQETHLHQNEIWNDMSGILEQLGWQTCQYLDIFQNQCCSHLFFSLFTYLYRAVWPSPSWPNTQKIASSAAMHWASCIWILQKKNTADPQTPGINSISQKMSNVMWYHLGTIFVKRQFSQTTWNVPSVTFHATSNRFLGLPFFVKKPRGHVSWQGHDSPRLLEKNPHGDSRWVGSFNPGWKI